MHVLVEIRLNKETFVNYTFIRVPCAGSCFCILLLLLVVGVGKCLFSLRTTDGVETHDGLQPLTLQLDDDSFMCHDMQRNATTCHDIRRVASTCPVDHSTP